MSQPAQPVRPFGGRIGRTLAESEAWFEEPAHPGEDAPNVVVVLLDDTGFAQLGCYGSTIDTPHIDALARRRRAVHQLPRHAAVLADSGVAAHRALAARRRDAVGVELPHRVPASARPHLRPRRDDRRGAARRGLRHVLLRQVAPRADGGLLGCRTVRAMAAGTRLRPVLRVPGGRDRPVPPRAGLRQPSDRSARAARGRLPPQRGPRRPAAADDRRQQGRAARPPVLRLPARSAPRTRRTRRRPRTWRSIAAPSTRAGTSCASVGTNASSRRA